MPHAAIRQYLLAALASLPPVADSVERQDGAEFFDRQRMIRPDAVKLGHEHPRPVGDIDAGSGCDLGGGLADQ